MNNHHLHHCDECERLSGIADGLRAEVERLTPAVPVGVEEQAERAYHRQNERIRNKVEGQYGPYTNADWADVNALYRAARPAVAPPSDETPVTLRSLWGKYPNLREPQEDAVAPTRASVEAAILRVRELWQSSLDGWESEKVEPSPTHGPPELRLAYLEGRWKGLGDALVHLYALLGPAGVPANESQPETK